MTFEVQKIRCEERRWFPKDNGFLLSNAANICDIGSSPCRRAVMWTTSAVPFFCQAWYSDKGRQRGQAAERIFRVPPKSASAPPLRGPT